MEEHLKKIFLEAKLREEKKLSIIEGSPSRDSKISLSLQGINEIFFLHDLFIEKNIRSAKFSLARMGFAKAYWAAMNNKDVFGVLSAFCFPILSDNSKLIDRYLTYKPIEFLDAFSTFFGQAIQGVMKDDNHLLEASVSGMKKYVKGDGWEKNFKGVPITFRGFLDQKKELVDEGISLLLSTHDSQGVSPITKPFINYEATTLAKLAHIKGIEIKVKSSLIPESLIPNKELEEYPAYKFMGDMFQ